jgi:DNA-binding transcriptional ArsR family regulator
VIIIIIKNKQLSEKELTQIFNLLKHPLRRAILKQLSKSPRAYSQILKNLNIQESSILNYHLREMDDLMIKKDVNGKYILNEIGEICLQLILRVKEKEDIHSFNKFQLVIENLKSVTFLFQIIFLPLVVFLALELYLLNIINFSSILGMFTSGSIFSIVISTGVLKRRKESESISVGKFGKKEKFGMFSVLFTIWILTSIIVSLLFYYFN